MALHANVRPPHPPHSHSVIRTLSASRSRLLLDGVLGSSVQSQPFRRICLQVAGQATAYKEDQNQSETKPNRLPALLSDFGPKADPLCRLPLSPQAQEDIQSRSTPGISLTQGHAQQNKSFQQNTPTPNPEASGQRKRLVSTVDDFTDFV